MNLHEFCNNNGYYLKDRIDYDWDRYNNGVPSVTSILGLIGDKSFDFVKKFHAKTLNDAASEGTRVHDEAEHYFKKKSGITKVNKNILKFHTLYVNNIISTEKRYTRGGISGTLDLIADVDYHRYKGTYSIDYKNCKMKSNKYKVQLGGYKYLSGYDGLLVYAKDKLDVIEVEDFYLDIFIELKDYFFKLLKDDNDNMKISTRKTKYLLRQESFMRLQYDRECYEDN